MTTTASTTDPLYAFAATCLARLARIVREDHARVARLAREDILSGTDIDLDLALDDTSREACETFRRRFHPEARRVWAAQFNGRAEVYVVHASGESCTVYDAPLLAASS